MARTTEDARIFILRALSIIGSTLHGFLYVPQAGENIEFTAVQKQVADLGEGPRGGGDAPRLFWVKKEEMTEGSKAGWASKIKPDPLLKVWIRH